MQDDDELPSDEEEILVFVEFEDCADANMLSNKQLHLDMLGLDTEHPIMQVNGRFFEGTFEDAIGTYMFFDKDDNPKVDDPVFDTVPTLKYFAKTKKLLKMQRVFVKHHTEVFGDSDHGDCVPNLKILQEAGVPIKYQNEALDFWTNVRNNRMNALNAYLEKQRIREEKKLLGIAIDSDTDEDNPFAAYNPKNDLSKVGKSKTQKKEETVLEKDAHQKEMQEETVGSANKVNIVNKEQKDAETKLNEEKNSNCGEIEENEATLCKKLHNLKALEELEHSCKSLNTKNVKGNSEEENSSELSLAKSVEQITSLGVSDNRDSQGLRTKVTSTKVLARKNKVFFPPSSLGKKRLKNKSSAMNDGNMIRIKDTKNIATNEKIKKDEQQHTEEKNSVGFEGELHDERKKEEELDKSSEIRQQQMLTDELNNKMTIADEQMKGEKEKDTKCKDKKNTDIADDERLQSPQSQRIEEHNKHEYKATQDERELNTTEFTVQDKMEMEKNDKRLRKQEKRKQKLKEITERLKVMADNYKKSNANVQ